MRDQLRMLAGVVILLFLASRTQAASSYADWTYRRPVTLSVATATNGYQVRVNLTTGTFSYASCDAAGNDLRFEDPNTQASLPYWIQSWTNSGSGTSVIWVAVANAGSTNLWLYYGKSGAPAASSGTNTFEFFDDFNAGNMNKWVARVSNGVVTCTGGYVEVGGGTTGGNYGHTAMATAFYTNFVDAVLEGSVYLMASSIAEVGFRDVAPNSGYKSRMDARASGGGISHLKSPYSNWTQFDSQTATPVGSLAWKPFRITVNGSSMTIAVDGQTRASTDTQYAGPGEISLQNHYGTYSRYDDIRVRKYAATEPTATVGAEQFVPAGQPTVSNSIGATNVTSATAWLNVVLVSTGGATTAWGILWGTNNPGAFLTGWTGGGSIDLGTAGGNNLTNTALITGLTPNSTYYYTCWATNALGTNVAAPTVFTTKGPPSVDNNAGASGIGVNTATLNGYLSVTGGLPTEVYVYWGPDTNNWANTNYLGFRGVGAFSVPLTGIYYGVPYYYRAYAVNSASAQWAPASASFQTLVPQATPSWPTGWRTNAWTGDADSGISSSFTYLVAINPNPSAGSVTINGVTFGTGKSGANYTISGLGNEHGPDTNNVTNNSFNLARYFSYGGNPASVSLANLTIGKRYQASFYAFGWEAAGNRYQTFANTGGTSCYVDQDFYGQNNGIRISYGFDATATTASFTITPGGGNTFHLSGLSVAQDNVVPATLGVTNTGATAAAPGSAIFNALVQATGSVFDVWVYYGLADGTNNPAAWGGSTLVTRVTNATSTNVSATVSGLPAGTVWFTYRIVNAATNYWAAPSASAVVQALADAPVISTQPETGVLTNTASLNGFLSSTGTSETVVSVYWGPGGDQILSGAWAFTNDFGACSYLPPAGLAYSTNVTGLTPGQQYTYRYYAMNASTGVCGEARSFYTALPPTADNGNGATAISATNATLHGTVLAGIPSPQAWIYWGTADAGTSKAAWSKPAVSCGTVAPGAFAATVYGLLANQTYWYRCYVSNGSGEAWAAASTNFTTSGPLLSIGNNSVPEGAQGTTTTAVLTVTLSATSAVAVSVSYASANGASAAAGVDYYATNGTLTLPAGTMAGTVTVTAIGNDLYEPNKLVLVNVSTPVNAAFANTQGVVTIANDDWTVYVRGDGLGNNTNAGSSWSKAWATLQKAFDSTPYSTQLLVHVEASASGQAYAPVSRTYGGYPTPYPATLNLQGGWQNVDTAAAQTGMSSIQSAATNQDAIHLQTAWHGTPIYLTLNRFAISNVLNGISFLSGDQTDNSGTITTMSNTTIRAQNHGIYLNYPRATYPLSYAMPGAIVLAENVDIAAGLGGTGDGIFILGPWMGSKVRASGIDPVTGAARVSTITALNGSGVNLAATYNGNGAHGVQLSNVVLYACQSNGVVLSTGPSDAVQVTLRNCTIAQNGGHGVGVTTGSAATWVSATNCIFASNAGHGISLGTNGGPTFASMADYNVFFNDDIHTNGAVQTFGINTSTADPLLYGQGARPSPYYLLRSATSPAYRRGSDGRNMGAYQNDRIAGGTALLFR
jgi:hypothetical protein